MTSFLTRGTYGGLVYEVQMSTYHRLFRVEYLGIFFSSVKLSFLTCLLCATLAIPMTWALTTIEKKARVALILVLALPFLTNLLIRIYAIQVFVGADGALQKVLSVVGLPFDPYQISQNQVLVLYGMVTTYLPFMIFPIFAAMEKFDFTLVEAAKDLGASNLRILFHVILPGLRKAILNGCILVFVPCLGEFLIPDLLGGAKNMLLGNLITEQFLKNRDWPMGSTLSVMLFCILIGIPFLVERFSKKSEAHGA